MKEAELRKHTDCTVCGGKITAAGVPLFYRVTIERFGIDLRAVRRQSGLAQFLGGSPQAVAIAEAMGPDEDMAQAMMEPTVVTVCETCSMRSVCVAELGLRE